MIFAKKIYALYILINIFISSFWVQSQTLKGIVTSQNIPVEFVNIFSKDSEKGTSSSSSGEYVFNKKTLGLNKLIFLLSLEKFL